MDTKRILISQPEPENSRSPFYNLECRFDVQIDYRQFITIEGVPAKEFRKNKFDITAFTSVLFTSKIAVDHFFRLSNELKFTIPGTMRYYCMSEAIAFYLQKYIPYRKRRVFYGNNHINDLLPMLKKNSNENCFLPQCDNSRNDTTEKLKKAKVKFSKAIMYRTVSADLSDLKEKKYDILVFYSPAGVQAFFENFPDFHQNNVHIATFGKSTANALKEAGYCNNIVAPTEKAPSMTKALELFLEKTVCTVS